MLKDHLKDHQTIKKLIKKHSKFLEGGEGPRPLPLLILWDSSHFHTDPKNFSEVYEIRAPTKKQASWKR